MEVALPKTLRLEPTPDNPRVAAIMWGPLALAGDLGVERPRGERQTRRVIVPKTPVLVAALQPPAAWLKPAGDHFVTDGVVRIPGESANAPEMTLAPFYRVHHRNYEIYFDLFTAPEWTLKQAEYTAAQDHQHALEAATLGFAQPGEMQPERDFNYQAGDGASVQRANGVAGRRANTWFSFDMPVDAASAMALVVTYFNAEQVRQPQHFSIEVDRRPIADETIERGAPQRFFDKQYAIPADAVAGKQRVTVKFTAAEGAVAGTVFGVRTIRLN